jgi:hypothetical protein
MTEKPERHRAALHSIAMGAMRARSPYSGFTVEELDRQRAELTRWIDLLRRAEAE